MEVWQYIKKCLEKNLSLRLLYVVRSEGSSPGRQGFKMAIASDGSMLGSIGGGIMEHKLVEMLRNQMQKGISKIEIIEQVHRKEKGKQQSGMICSGEQTIVLCPIEKEQLGLVDIFLNSLKNKNEIALKIDLNGISYTEELPENKFEFHFKDKENWKYKERIAFKNQVFIIGGGHVGLAMSRQLSLLDFEVSIIDDRSGLNTMEANSYVANKIVCPYADVGQHISGGENQYIIIMTFGYRGDDVAVRQLLHKNFAYLGMMGSQTKIDKLLNGLKEDGFPKNQIEQLIAPIGLSIDSKTPAEIAISVAAQLVAVKNRI